MAVTVMESEGSITGWIGALKRGDRGAAQQLWNVYIGRLVELARARLRYVPRGAADEEDVALSAFESFFRGAEEHRFPRLDDRDDLWQLLVVITVRKACNLARHELRQSRGAGQVRSLSDLAECGGDDPPGIEPTPELAAQVDEECRRLLGLLRDESLRAVALLKLEGYTNEEIAAKLGCVRFTVDRKLRAIRQIWEGERAG
jgi:DNA-directed RNA polymerase specialized sigma24 family protein